MARMSYAEAVIDALYRAMAEDEAVCLIGSHVLGLGPQRGLVDRLREGFPGRVLDPPTAEEASASIGIGAAMAGARPFVDIGTASFIFQAWPQIVNEAANARYMSGGTIDVPVVFHMLHGLRGGGAAQHSHSPQAMLWNCPGLEIVLPSTPRDAKGLITAAIRSRNPTVVLDHAKLLGIEGEVPDGDFALPLGEAEIKRAGGDATVVATSLMVHVALEAAEALARDGIEVEILDPRTLVPLDLAAILASVEKTGRLVVVDECNTSAGIASEICASVSEHGFGFLKAPVARVARPDVPVPFSPPLEQHITPSAARVERAVRGTLDAL